ncbi:hypothetical protein [Actinomadura napierensis]|uniref:SAV-6107-like HEPN domain-containing protein n=1 Tax=Actinomadura napierensis TaxID=267854 RepID=A0ABP5M911_9ACTN
MRRAQTALRRRVVTAVWRTLGPGGACATEIPEPVFLFAGLTPQARSALEALPEEARAWRALARREAARAGRRARDGRIWDAGVCAGRAHAYRAAAAQLEELLMESLGLWEQYERQVGEGG